MDILLSVLAKEKKYRYGIYIHTVSTTFPLVLTALSRDF